MEIRKSNLSDVTEVVLLLNKYLSFGLAKESKIALQIENDISYTALHEGKVVGYVNSLKLSKDQFNLSDSEFEQLPSFNEDDIYVSLLVVSSEYRSLGIGFNLIKETLNNIPKDSKALSIGWIKSDSNKWEAETLCKNNGFKDILFIENYFNRDNVYCGVCNDICKCSANIVGFNI